VSNPDTSCRAKSLLKEYFAQEFGQDPIRLLEWKGSLDVRLGRVIRESKNTSTPILGEYVIGKFF
jgi:hypothetical protein